MLWIRRARRELSSILTISFVLGLISISPSWALGQTLGPDESEDLVRAVYFEGLPEEKARRVGANGAERLIEMLFDASESATHANILLVLGLSGQPGAFEAIADWSGLPRDGEIDRDTFKAWQALPYALGYLAEHDPRAVERLKTQLSGETPTWTFRHHRGARIHRLGRRAAATALGMSGSPEAGDALDEAVVESSDPDFDSHLRSARAMHRRRAAGWGRPR